jgi:hypothetical protein
MLLRFLFACVVSEFGGRDEKQLVSDGYGGARSHKISLSTRHVINRRFGQATAAAAQHSAQEVYSTFETGCLRTSELEDD